MQGSLLLLGLLAAAPALADSHPYTIEDQVALDRVSDPQPSPTGGHVAFVRRVADVEANKGRYDLWLVAATGGAPRRLTSHDAADNSPRWSPDGRVLYFLSTRSGSSQVWKLALDGGEAEAVTRLPLDVGSFALSPDGSRLAVSMEVFTDCQDLACTVQRLADKAAAKSSGNLYTGLFIRHWDTWADGRRSHLFVLAADGSGTPVDVMAGMIADAPSKPFGGAEEYTFTPDSKGLVFSAKDNAKGDEAWTTNFDLWYAPVDGEAPPRDLTADNLAWDTQPQFSPDGKQLLYLAMSRPGFEADRFRIMVRPWSGGEPGEPSNAREVAAGWDTSPDGVVWSRDGKTLYATAEWRGNKPLWAIDVATGAARPLVAEGNVKEARLLRGTGSGRPATGDRVAPDRVAGDRVAGDRLVFTLEHLRAPGDVWSIEVAGGGRRQLTDVNHDRLAAIRFGEPEQITFTGANGDQVYAWVVKPVDFDPAKKYPLAFLIHGGPQGSFGNDFHFRWNPQVYAGRGYAAVMVDFHGSTGYGQAFTDAIRDDWGGKPLVDLQQGMAAAVARYPWLDGSRACALGASYGGYMINWIAGNWPDGFRCLVNHDGSLDERAMFYATEELWFPEWESKGTPWTNAAGYETHNPINFVQNWRTPMLVIHGGLDFRIPDTQAFSTFTALQRRGIPSMFLHFPDENHWVLKPQNSLQWHHTVLDWLDRFAKPE